MQEVILTKKAPKKATSGEYIGEFVEANAFSTSDGRNFMVVTYKYCGDWYGEHLFSLDGEDELLAEFIDALNCEGATVAELNEFYQGKEFYFEIEEVTVDSKIYPITTTFLEIVE